MTEYHHRAVRKMEKYIRPKAFRKEELVLRRTFEEGKLKLNWEGPYIIIDDGCKGEYKLQSPDGKMEPRTWNSRYLKRYYQ